MADEAQRTDGEMLTYMGTDAMKWAEEWVRTARGVYERDGITALIGHADQAPDGGWMSSWFASAIETGRSAGRRETCPHAEIITLGEALGSCRLCGKLFEYEQGDPVDA